MTLYSFLGCPITAHQPHNAHNSIENGIFASGLCGRQCVTGSTHSLCIISNPLNVTSRSSHNEIINIYSVRLTNLVQFANLVEFANKWPVCNWMADMVNSLRYKVN
jgi:hypothetical protein